MLLSGWNIPFAQRLLLCFCHTAEQALPNIHYQPASELDELNSLFPDLQSAIAGKRVIDFGCGHGYQSVRLAQCGAAHVTGTEIEDHLVLLAQQRVHDAGLHDRVQILSALDGVTADIVVSQNSFEHFLDPAATLGQLKRALAPAGKMYVTFGPLWLSPRGAHMAYFCRLPWVNLFFSESTVMAVRSRFRSDGKATYAQAGLGKLTVRRFEQLLAQSGLRVEWQRYDAVARLPLVARIPLLRELFINRITCVLALANGGHAAN